MSKDLSEALIEGLAALTRQEEVGMTGNTRRPWQKKAIIIVAYQSLISDFRFFFLRPYLWSFFQFFSQGGVRRRRAKRVQRTSGEPEEQMIYHWHQVTRRDYSLSCRKCVDFKFVHPEKVRVAHIIFAPCCLCL